MRSLHTTGTLPAILRDVAEEIEKLEKELAEKKRLLKASEDREGKLEDEIHKLRTAAKRKG